MRKKIILTSPYPTQEEIIETYGLTKAQVKRVDRIFKEDYPELAKIVSQHRAAAARKSSLKQGSTYARKKTA